MEVRITVDERSAAIPAPAAMAGVRLRAAARRSVRDIDKGSERPSERPSGRAARADLDIPVAPENLYPVAIKIPKQNSTA